MSIPRYKTKSILRKNKNVTSKTQKQLRINTKTHTFSENGKSLQRVESRNKKRKISKRLISTEADQVKDRLKNQFRLFPTKILFKLLEKKAKEKQLLETKNKALKKKTQKDESIKISKNNLQETQQKETEKKQSKKVTIKSINRNFTDKKIVHKKVYRRHFKPDIASTQTMSYTKKADNPIVKKVLQKLEKDEHNYHIDQDALAHTETKSLSQFSKNIQKYFVNQNRTNEKNHSSFSITNTYTHSLYNREIDTDYEKQHSLPVSARTLKKLQTNNKSLSNFNILNHNPLEIKNPIQNIMINNFTHFGSSSEYRKPRAYSLENSNLQGVNRSSRHRFLNYRVDDQGMNYQGNFLAKASTLRQPMAYTSNLRESAYSNSDIKGRAYRSGFGQINSPSRSFHYKDDAYARQNQYKKYLQTDLPSVNELNTKQSMQSTLERQIQTYSTSPKNDLLPLDFKNLLMLLFKKILVYSSKINSLQKKLLEIDPLFDGAKIIREIDSEQKHHLSLHDLAYFVHLFGFKLSDWDTFRMMCYLSKYNLATLEELILEEKIWDAQQLIVQGSEFRDSNQKNIQNERVLDLNKNRKSYSVTYKEFLNLFIPFERRQEANKKEQKTFSKEERAKNEYHVIRQIILLTFRKLDEMGFIIQKLRSFEVESIFEHLANFNDEKFLKKSFKFMGSFGHGNNFLNARKSKFYSILPQDIFTKTLKDNEQVFVALINKYMQKTLILRKLGKQDKFK